MCRLEVCDIHKMVSPLFLIMISIKYFEHVLVSWMVFVLVGLHILCNDRNELFH